MKLSSFLYICFAAATFTTLTNTASGIYDSTSSAIHSGLEKVDDLFKKTKVMYYNCLKTFCGKVRDQIAKRQVPTHFKSLKGFLDKMKSYVNKGRKTVEEEKKIELEEEKEKKNKQKHEL